MRFVELDQLILYEAEGRVQYDMVEPDKSYVTRIQSTTTCLSHDIRDSLAQTFGPIGLIFCKSVCQQAYDTQSSSSVHKGPSLGSKASSLLSKVRYVSFLKD